MMEPSDSGGVGAVEVVADGGIARPVPTFLSGACAGIALAAVAVQCWLAVILAPLRGAYKDMAAGARVPFVLHPWWLRGAPAAGIVALALLGIWRPRRIVPYACLAVALIAVAIATAHYAYAPLYELADEIRE